MNGTDSVLSALVMYDLQLKKLLPKLTTQHLEQIQAAISVELQERDNVAK